MYGIRLIGPSGSLAGSTHSILPCAAFASWSLPFTHSTISPQGEQQVETRNISQVPSLYLPNQPCRGEPCVRPLPFIPCPEGEHKVRSYPLWFALDGFVRCSIEIPLGKLLILAPIPVAFPRCFKVE